MEEVDLNTNRVAFIEDNVIVHVLRVDQKLSDLFLSDTQRIDFTNLTNADLVVPGDIYDPETNTIINVDTSATNVIEYPDRRNQ
jgi:hypothetical protein